MRASLLAAVPLLVALSALPAEGQVSARVHIDIPIGRQPGGAYASPRHQLMVREYDQRRYGDWGDYFDEWVPETVYLCDGYYYDYPIFAYAQPVVVYRYRNDIFFAPRQREFIQWRERRDYRDIGRAYRQMPRNDRDEWQYRQPRDGRDGRDGRDDRDDKKYRPEPGHGRNGWEGRPVPQDGRNRQDVRSAPQDGRIDPPARNGDRSRPRPH